jgi:hypothetical protein
MPSCYCGYLRIHHELNHTVHHRLFCPNSCTLSLSLSLIAHRVLFFALSPLLISALSKFQKFESSQRLLRNVGIPDSEGR